MCIRDSQDIVRYTGRVGNITLIPNGVLHQARYAEVRAQCAERWKRTSPFTFVLVGLIHPSKGQVEAVEALELVRAQRPETRLLIAGEGRGGPQAGGTGVLHRGCCKLVSTPL